MNNFQKMSETEMEVMQVIWEVGRPVITSELLGIFSQDKGKKWKGQTIATFLARLIEKGILMITEKNGRVNTYAPRMSPEEYRSQEAKSLLETLYDGSVKNFLATLYDGKELTKNEIAELRRWFAEKAGEKNG
ncbi:MAG: BlaI/MecI/CopY family transcriptional regulator [Bacillota bacterium]|jgi:BlaI family penicillinase repressor